mgnify:CR=1 FL=1
MFGDGGQSETFEPQQPCSDFRIKQTFRLQSQINESRQILQRIMQNPYRIAHRTIEIVPIGTFRSQCLRIKQSYAAPSLLNCTNNRS